jgi:hypothetical protein
VKDIPSDIQVCVQSHLRAGIEQIARMKHACSYAERCIGGSSGVSRYQSAKMRIAAG